MNYVAEYSGLIPLLLVAAFGRDLPRAWWWVAFGLAVSVFGDSLQRMTGGAWAMGPVWLPAQFGLVLFAFATEPLWRWCIVAGAVLLGTSSYALAPTGPDWLVLLAGSAAVLAMARGGLAVPLWIYFGLGSIAFLLMIDRRGEGVYPWWLGYQACRWTAFAAFAVVMTRARRAHG